MKYTRIYGDPIGESHFEDVEVELKLVDFAPPAAPATARLACSVLETSFLERTYLARGM